MFADLRRFQTRTFGFGHYPVAIVVVGSPTVTVVSKNETDNKDICEITWNADETFIEYKVKAVNSTDATHNTGTQIPTTDSSSNVQGIGVFPANENITTTIDGDDLWEAMGSDGTYIIKIFIRNYDYMWST